jgi:hypothetical protein
VKRCQESSETFPIQISTGVFAETKEFGLLGLGHPRKRQTGRKAGTQSYGPLS